MSAVRVGQGFDVHPFSDDPQRPLVLGGVAFTGERGLAGHSDADVVTHAVIDALFGAAGAVRSPERPWSEVKLALDAVELPPATAVETAGTHVARDNRQNATPDHNGRPHRLPDRG